MRFLTVSLALLSMLVACNPVFDKVTGSVCQGLHPVKWGGQCHGARYLEPFANCSTATCHGTNLRGGNTGAPSCYGCHNYDIWNYMKDHNRVISGKQHYKSVCDGVSFNTACGLTDCHGATLLGGTYGPSCTKSGCHLTSPPHDCAMLDHTVTYGGHRHYKSVCNTGVVFTTVCGLTDCHGATLLGGTYGPSCTKSGCHSVTPTGCAWALHTDNKDGARHYQNTCSHAGDFYGFCGKVGCHGDGSGSPNGLNGDAGPRCRNCHGSVPSNCDK